MSACTALQALRAGRLEPGQRVLVIGAGGGVGTYAVQPAKALGAGHVTGACSTPPKADLVRPLCADEVVDHLREDPADGVHPYDLRTLGGLIESGALPPALDRTYPLAEVPDAVRRLRDGRVRGEIAIRVGGSGHDTRPGAEPAEGG